MPLQNTTAKLFPKPSARNLAIGVGAGILLFSFTTFAKQKLQKVEHTSSIKLPYLVETLYPHCQQEILEIYSALGLTQLLEMQLSTVSSQEQALNVLNTTIQKILLRPQDVQRYQLKDDTYLAMVEKRLDEAYRSSGFSETPLIDRKRLKEVLTKPILWDTPLHAQNKDFNAVILLGSSYQDYLNRQNFFFDLLKKKKINPVLNSDGQFPVYLLGGDRPLNAQIDAPIIDSLKEKKLPLNEQAMMNELFDRAQHDSQNQSFHLKPVGTYAPKEAGGRPTTAGTLDALVPLLKNEKRVLVISTAPFIRYQKLVTERQFLKHGLTLEMVAAGPSLKSEMESHPKLAETALMGICLDTLAREVYEMKLIADLKNNNKPKTKISPR